jgi:uncharacterized protein
MGSPHTDMKLLILSDTHDNYPLAIKALEHAGDIDQIIHLGDGVDDARIIEYISEKPVIMVAGNCDSIASVPRDIRTMIARKEFFLTHGHNYHVKSGLTQLYNKAVAEEVSIVLYGHTHIAAIETINDVMFVNPGCLRHNTFTSYATLSISAGNISAEIIEIR